MNFDQIKELIDKINHSDLRTFELSMDNVSVKMSKNQWEPSAHSLNTIETAEIPHVTNTIGYTENLEAENITKEEAEISESEGTLITSPIVGTFYASPGPGEKNYVQVGQEVKKGDVLCIVEAMKVMNEIVSTVDGKIGKIYVSNEQLVEYGQPLFQII